MKLVARLSKPGATIASLLKLNHSLDGHATNWASINGSEIYYGTSFTGVPDWTTFVSSGLSSPLIDLSNKGAAALIFVPIDNRYMVFSFGYGSQNLTGLHLEKDFGLKVVLNTVHPEGIRSVDSKTLEAVVINRRIQLSTENQIFNFGFEINKDFLRQIEGRPTDTLFASSIAGSDGLTLNCDVTSGDVQQKVADIYGFYQSTAYKANFSWIDNIRSVRDGALINQLNTNLLTAFNDLLSGNTQDIQLSCPQITENNIAYYKIRGYRSSTEFVHIDIDRVVNDLTTNGIQSLTQGNINSYKITSIDENGQVLNTWCFRDWLVFETNSGNDNFLLSEGDWYKVSVNYFNSVNTAFNATISNITEFQQLPLTTHNNEESYIANYPFRRSQEFKFDRELSYVYGGGNSIEICDIYNANKEFIHIKDGGAASKLSHLFNQGFVSARSFLNDVRFRNDITGKLSGRQQLVKTIGNNIDPRRFTIVYRIIKSGSSFNLSFFSKVVVNEVRAKLINMGYRFRLEWVPKA